MKKYLTKFVILALLILSIWLLLQYFSSFQEKDLAQYPLYQFEDLGIEFRLPSDAIQVERIGNSIHLSHSVPHEFEERCSELMRSPKKFSRLYDFYKVIEFSDLSVENFIREDFDWLDDDALFSDLDNHHSSSQRIDFNFLTNGYAYRFSFDGCDLNPMYFPLARGSVKIVGAQKDSQAYLLNLNSENRSAIPGLLFGDQSEYDDAHELIHSTIKPLN